MADTRTLEILVKVRDLATKAVGGIVGTFAKMGGAISAAFNQIAIGALRQIGVELLALPGKLIAATEAFIDNADKTQKMAAALGTTVESLQEMTFAAGQSGLSMDELTNATKFFVKALEQAHDKSGEQRLLFRKLGIDVDELREGQLDLVEVYAKVADGLKGIANPTERAAILMKLFGRSGNELMLTLEEGGKGIRALAKDFRDLGGSISAETVRLADALGDEVNRAKVAFQGIFNSLISESLPQITKFFNGIVEVLKKNRGDIVAHLKVLGGDIVIFLEVLTTAFATVADLFRNVASGLTVIVLALKTGLEAIRQSTDELTVAQIALKDAISDISRREFFEYQKKIAGTWSELKRLGKATADVSKATKDLGNDVDDAADKSKDFGVVLGTNLDKLGQGLKGGGQQILANFFEAGITGARNFKNAIKDMGEAVLRMLARLIAEFAAAQIFGLIFGVPITPGAGGKPARAGASSVRGGGGSGFGGFGSPSGMGGGGGSIIQNITILANDAKSFAAMLANRESRRAIAEVFGNEVQRNRNLILDVRGA